MSEAEYTCPKCGGPAELDQGYESKVTCPKCGETKIIMTFLSNGDIETVAEGTNEYYELEPSARKALKEIEEAKDDIALIDAKRNLVSAYSETGREGKAETLSKEVFELIRKKDEEKVPGMHAKYIDQASVCAAFATSRGNYTDASDIYLDALEYLGDEESMEVASLKVNYGFLCTMKKSFPKAERAFKEALEIIEKCFAKGEIGEDPYIRATVYDSLRLIASKNNNNAEAEQYMEKAVEERRRLVNEAPVNSARLIELTDALGFMAEIEAKKSNDKGAEEYLDEAIAVTKKFPDCKEAQAHAIMVRAKYRQARSPEPPEGLLEDMDFVIPALEAMQFKDKLTREDIAQAYMFRSMVRDPKDYDNLLKDLEGSYTTLLELAQDGDVNEMFFMSAAHSYLTLLNMKDQDKAKKVRGELLDLGISQQDLDEATRGTIGNVSTKRTKVEILTSNQNKPIPGRRLKRQVKHKGE